MLEAFFINIFFLFVQISISTFLIWLCKRKDEEDDDNYVVVKSFLKKKFKLNVLIELFFVLLGFILLLINIAGVDIGIFLNSKNKDSFSVFQFYIGLNMISMVLTFFLNLISVSMLKDFKYRQYCPNGDEKYDEDSLSKYYIRSLFF